MAASPNYYARGTISPSVFVVADTATNFGVVQANTTGAGLAPIVGVSQDGPHDTPGLSGAGTSAATTGQVISVFGDGEECLITMGGTVTDGDLLIADGSGRAIKAQTTTGAVQYIGGKALETGAVGELRRILVAPQVYYHT